MKVKCTSQIAVFVLLLFSMCLDLKAQTPNFDCPSDFNVNTWTNNTNQIDVNFKFVNHPSDHGKNTTASITSHWRQGVRGLISLF